MFVSNNIQQYTFQTVIGEDGQEVPKTIDDIDDPNYYR
jgi:hypothetical protein